MDYKVFLEDIAARTIHKNEKFEKLPKDELWELYTIIVTHTRRSAMILFPAQIPGYVTNTKLLGHWAANWVTYKNLEDAGDEVGAAKYLAIAERIFERMPHSVQKRIKENVD